MNASYKQSDLVPTSLVRRVSFHRKDPGYASVPGRLQMSPGVAIAAFPHVPRKPCGAEKPQSANEGGFLVSFSISGP